MEWAPHNTWEVTKVGGSLKEISEGSALTCAAVPRQDSNSSKGKAAMKPKCQGYIERQAQGE